ncbi:uncharacterized protein LOC136083018 [Hydra vulgaris]|uniref:Uncharacterized protein LOC136083018 n=1 Tax=Hydra vulgaris TaxID=6087 RepID=A0ABM4CA04_HYDVU
MEVMMKNIEKLISTKLDEQKKGILTETAILLKNQEKILTDILSANLKIITDRLYKLENEFNKNKSKLVIVEKDIIDLKESINFQEENFLNEILQTNGLLDIEIGNLKNKFNYLEKRSRQNSLRIDGLTELPTETWNDRANELKNIFINKLGISEEIIVERAYRIGKIKEDKSSRTMIIKLLDFQNKNKILTSAKKLKGTGIFINEDFSNETMEIRKKLWEEVKQLRKEGKYAIIKYDKIFVREFRK